MLSKSLITLNYICRYKQDNDFKNLLSFDFIRKLTL